MNSLIYRDENPAPAHRTNGHASASVMMNREEIGPGDTVEIDNVPVLYTVQCVLPGIDGKRYAIVTYGEDDGHMVIALVSVLRLVGRAV